MILISYFKREVIFDDNKKSKQILCLRKKKIYKQYHNNDANVYLVQCNVLWFASQAFSYETRKGNSKVTAPSLESKGADNDSTNTAALVGGIVAALIVVAVVGLLGFFFRRYVFLTQYVCVLKFYIKNFKFSIRILTNFTTWYLL